MALHLFAELPGKALRGDVVSYNALINACGKAWKWQEGLQILSNLPGGEDDDDEFFFPGKMKMVHLLVVDNGLRGLGQWFSWELWLEPPLGNSPLGFIRMDTQVGCVQTSSLLVRP